MQELLGSPAMITVLVIILVMEALSLFLLLINIKIFRSQSKKYRLLLANLGSQSALGKPGHILIPLYIVSTLGVTAVTTMIFIFQPHLL